MAVREDFRIVSKYYATSTLVMIFHNDKIVESVESFKNYKTFEDETSKAERLAEKKSTKPIKMKTSKEKRSEQEIMAECERLIKKYLV